MTTEQHGKYETHDQILTRGGDLHGKAKSIPELRERIEALPETAATFRIPQFDGFEHATLPKPMLEFVKSWRVPERFNTGQQKSRLFVNPHCDHAKEYADAYVECRCGETFVHSTGQETTKLRDRHNHEDNCRPWWRLETRTTLAKRRDQMSRYLAQIGWGARHIGPRLGLTRNSIGSLMKRNQTSLTEQKQEFKRIAGNTYGLLVRERGEDPDLVADIYDTTRATLSKWTKEHSVHGPVDDDPRFGRDQFGRFGWASHQENNRPDFVEGQNNDP